MKKIGVLVLLIMMLALMPSFAYATPTLRANYYAGYQAKTLVWGTTHGLSQSFTVTNGEFNITGVEFSGFRIAGYYGGVLIANIYLADVNHKPTGESLTNGALDSIYITQVDNSPEAYIIPMLPYVLQDETEYCVTFMNDLNTETAYCTYIIQDTGGAGGAYTTEDSASTWDSLTGWTFYYGIWGEDVETGSIYSFNQTASLTVGASATKNLSWTKALTGSLTMSGTIAKITGKLITLVSSISIGGDVTLSRILTVILTGNINLDAIKHIYGDFEISNPTYSIPPIIVYNNTGLYVASLIIIILAILFFSIK